MFYGVKISNKDINNLAEQLIMTGVCRRMDVTEWLEYRETIQGYTRVAYSQGHYGVTNELFYVKNPKEFIII